MSADARGWDGVVYAFVILLVLRYLRFVVHAIAVLLYRPSHVPGSDDASYAPSDVTAVVASVEPQSREFEVTLRSLLDGGCSEVILVTIDSRLWEATQICESISPLIKVLSSSIANKRVQLCIGLRQVRTKLVLFADDHIWFDEPAASLRSIIAPFEDERIGGVAIGKRVQRVQNLPRWSLADMLNFLACLYLERHNFDLAATNTIDGGVFVISGRAAAYRSSIVCAGDFIRHFKNEFWFFGIGPLHADDDNCLTRWLVNGGWKIKFQHSTDALMHTSLGIDGPRKYHAQCLRWVRTTWRSNSTSLFRDGKVWRSQPWCVYAVYISSFFNFALFTDATLIALGSYSFEKMGIATGKGLAILLAWILFSKLVKLLSFLKRHPTDIVYFPVYVAFAYYHSFIKLWALLTVNSLTWGSRPNVVS